MKDIIETAIVALLVVLAAVMLVSTRGTDDTDWSKFKLDVKAKEDSFSYDIVESEYNGAYENKSSKQRIYAMLGKNPSGTYRLYFFKAFGQVKTTILMVDNLILDNTGKGIFSMEGYNGSTTVSYLNIECTPGFIRIFTDGSQAGSSDLKGSYQRYSIITRFDSNSVQISK